MAWQTDAFEVLEEIYQERNFLRYAAKQKIPLYEDDVWIVYRGVVQIQTFHYSGDESIIGMLGPMMPFNWLRVFSLCLYCLKVPSCIG